MSALADAATAVVAEPCLLLCLRTAADGSIPALLACHVCRML
jgi:hypothetical protein